MSDKKEIDNNDENVIVEEVSPIEKEEVNQDSDSEEVNMNDELTPEQMQQMQQMMKMLGGMGGNNAESDEEDGDEDDDEDDDEDGDEDDDDEEDGDYEEEGDDDEEGDNDLDIQELLLQYFENESRQNIPTVLTDIKLAIDNNSKCILKLVSEVRKTREESVKKRTQKK